MQHTAYTPESLAARAAYLQQQGLSRRAASVWQQIMTHPAASEALRAEACEACGVPVFVNAHESITATRTAAGNSLPMLERRPFTAAPKAKPLTVTIRRHSANGETEVINKEQVTRAERMRELAHHAARRANIRAEEKRKRGEHRTKRINPASFRQQVKRMLLEGLSVDQIATRTGKEKPAVRRARDALGLRPEGMPTSKSGYAMDMDFYYFCVNLIPYLEADPKHGKYKRIAALLGVSPYRVRHAALAIESNGIQKKTSFES